MDNYITALKDVLVILSPILIAYITYRGTKKTQKDIKLEIEKITQEKSAETNQILQKINAELSSQQQLISWQNSMPQTNEYLNIIDTKRRGNVSNLHSLIEQIEPWLTEEKLTYEELTELKMMLNRISLPNDTEELYPYEIPFLLEYKSLMKKITSLLNKINS